MTARSRAARALSVGAALLLLVGAGMGWASRTLFDSKAFAAHARQSLDSAAVRTTIARTLVRDVLETRDPELVAARPILETAAEVVVASPNFAAILEAATRGAHSLFVNRPTDNVVLRANEAVLLFIDTLRQYAPALAEQVPPDLDVALVEIRDASLELEAWRVADDVTWLAVALPLAAFVLWAVALGLAADRRREVEVIGLVVAVEGALLLAGIAIGRLLVGRTGNDATTVQAVRDVWDSYVSGLQVLAWFGIAAGLLIAAAAFATRPEGVRMTPAHIVSIARRIIEPASRRPVAIVGAAAVSGALGVAFIVQPLDTLQAVTVAFGLLIVYGSLIAVLELLARPGEATDGAERRARRARTISVAGLVGFLLVVGAIVALLAQSPEPKTPVLACNGSITLCDRRLDEVAFATTHNSMSAANDGYLKANQSEGIDAQLQRGVRGLLIDAYLATENGGTVFTDFTDLQRGKLDASVGPDLAARAEELRRIAGPPPDTAKQSLYLCHVFCELGATRADQAFKTLRSFLDQNPGEVVIVVVEDYVPPERLMAALRHAGLDRSLFEWDAGAPFPTLRAMIASDRRLFVMLEKQSGGPLMPAGYAGGVIQETPYAFPTAADLDAATSCQPNRGRSDAPLLLVNHFATPASITESAAANARDRLHTRARRCAAERQRFPNLVAVDFADRGDLIAVVGELNGVTPAPPAG